MGKYNLDKDGDLKRLEEEFRTYENISDLQAATPDAPTGVLGKMTAVPPAVMVTGILCAVLVIGALLYLAVINRGYGPLHQVPDAFGKDLSAALPLITEKGFRVAGVKYELSSKATPGTVIAQRPVAGTRVKPGEEDVFLTVAGAAPSDKTATTKRTTEPPPPPTTTPDAPPNPTARTHRLPRPPAPRARSRRCRCRMWSGWLIHSPKPR